MTSTPLQFDPLKLVVDPTFWQQFGTDKLHKHRLDDSDLNILGFYEAGGGQIPTQFCLSSAALLPADQRGTSKYYLNASIWFRFLIFFLLCEKVIRLQIQFASAAR